MTVVAAPLAADRPAARESWIAELTGPRKAGFEGIDDRHGLTAHEACLQPASDGGYLVLVVHEGPGADGYLASMASSDDAFDRSFIGRVAEVHEIDPGGPMPQPAERRL